jgi:hypothetical protein
MNVHVRFYAVAAVAVVSFGAAPLAAQSATQPDARETSPALVDTGIASTALIDSLTAVAAQPVAEVSTAGSRGPSLASARVASHAIRTTTHPTAPLIQNRTSNRNALALMIVGGAALVVGAVIGNDAGTLVMLGGAGIGLYGLYLFLT